MTFADHILQFFTQLKIRKRLPHGVSVLNPYNDQTSFELCSLFYHKFYDDNRARTLILGINPGRFGAGLTGIPFTDPIKLENVCNIPNSLPKRAELSADFIYGMIAKYGGPRKFFSRFYISSISPLGFVRDGKNMNYYDNRKLQSLLADFVESCLRQQLEFGLHRAKCIILGEGRNFQNATTLNDRLKIFDSVVPLAHPRFIMQYKRKHLEDYIDRYLKVLD